MGKSKILQSAAVSVAFVWFSTNYGGAFASGRQMLEFYSVYGGYALFMPIVSSVILSLVIYFGFKWAIEHKTTDYRSFANSFYRPFHVICGNLFEILAFFGTLLVTAAGIATAGHSVTEILGTPYAINTAVATLICYLLTIYGAEVVRKASRYVTYAIVIGVFVLYIPNIIAFWPRIMEIVMTTQASPVLADKTFGKAMMSAIASTGVQAGAVIAFITHSQILKTTKEVKQMVLVGFGLNTTIMWMASVCTLAFIADGAIISNPIPTLYIAQNGVLGSSMVPIVSILIFLGAISTAVNSLFGVIDRIQGWFSRKGGETRVSKRKFVMRNMISSGVYLCIIWLVTLAGIIKIIGKGYRFLGNAVFPIVVIPFIIRGIIGWKKPEEVKKVEIH